MAGRRRRRPGLTGLDPQAQVSRIELRKPGQIAEITDDDNAAAPVDQPGRAKFLQPLVDVHDGQAKQIGQLGLRQRQVERIPCRNPGSFQPQIQFAKEMRHSLFRRSAPQTGDPRPLDSGIDHRGEPEQSAEVRTFLGNAPDCVIGNVGDITRPYCDHSMIHDPQQISMQIYEITRDVKRGYLAAAVSRIMGPCCEALKYHATFARPAVFSYYFAAVQKRLYPLG